MRIAVVGSGISGLAAAFVLQREHEVAVFESSERVGGHTHTVDIEIGGRSYAVDTGFVVYNEATYPNFVRLLDLLGVGSQPTSMSFSVRCDATGQEYCGSSPNTLFAQRRNLLRPGFYRLILDILRFNTAASRALARGRVAGTLGEYLAREVPSPRLKREYLVPLVAAIWSMAPGRVDEFPAEFFLRFAARHRLLQARERLPWRVIRGGSREYVRALTARLRGPVRTRSPVRSIRRVEEGVELRIANGEPERFDRVVVATHSDEALRLLADPSDAEREVLSAFPYQENAAVLHQDEDLLPRAPRARANWNYRIRREARGDAPPLTTYDMRGLQGLDAPRPILITLNDEGAVAPARVLERLRYSHPVYDPRTVEAQGERDRISGPRRTHYCGAYWGFGFHEDGLASALHACRDFGLAL